jgi:hypothetical protein
MQPSSLHVVQPSQCHLTCGECGLAVSRSSIIAHSLPAVSYTAPPMQRRAPAASSTALQPSGLAAVRLHNAPLRCHKLRALFALAALAAPARRVAISVEPCCNDQAAICCHTRVQWHGMP